MGLRQEIVNQMSSILGAKKFIYGGYKSKPTLPYGNYARQESTNVFADNKTYQKINVYILRVVTDSKDFSLEEKVENMFDSLDIPYEVITDEDIKSEKAYCVEWMFSLCE
ncbi:hypothetical protein DXC78_09200 [Faecalicoccus pleomorphus]|uniref:Uncharacterized protein n=1 Tax=Faecalicoccus pleomorphus TaxID=1323 RepID=A0A3E3DZZ0_9FIRM|nr:MULTISPECIES: hypothetical protein [Faecalicoccus]MDY5110283.1 hypothetical protein [Faecalicoccus sp.]RGD74803.1 hypothetical protein DXC78_09200 [Faecalicoccus pleomorphus]